METDWAYIQNLSYGSALSLSPLLWILLTADCLLDLIGVKLDVESNYGTLKTVRY